MVLAILRFLRSEINHHHSKLHVGDYYSVLLSSECMFFEIIYNKQYYYQLSPALSLSLALSLALSLLILKEKIWGQQKREELR